MKVTHKRGNPRDLKLLDHNARFMRHETFQTLVENIKRDGVLSQWPFVYHDPETDERVVYSGNHRVKAAIEAGLDEIDWTECNEPLTRDQLIAIQLSHNAISGEDDPTILKDLYQAITDVDMKMYAGLDDKTLELLDQVEIGSLGEANLDFQTISIVFLPSERDKAKEALETATGVLNAREYWLAAYPQYDGLLDALDDVRSAHKIGNAATALMIIVDIFRNHVTDLQNAWMLENGEPAHTGTAPISSLLGYQMPAKEATKVATALHKAMKREDFQHPWQALTEWADAQ